MHNRATHTATTAIRLAIIEGAFKRHDLARALDDPPSTSTITRVLQQLEADGWLSRTTEQSSIWRAGGQIRVLCGLNKSAKKAADQEPTRPGDQHSPGRTDPFEDLL